MITSISLNPSIDRTLTVEGFTPGGLNRVLSSGDVAAGKGINVALTVSALGLNAECVGFMYRDSAPLFEKRLMMNSAAYSFVWCEGSVRTNIKVLDQTTQTITEINEPGVMVSESDLKRMAEMVALHAENSDYMVMAGSLPPGCPPDYYRMLIQSVEGLGCRCVLDADGEALKKGLEAKPFMIKPNRHELEKMVGHKFSSIQEIRDAAMRYIDLGVSIVAVSLGGDGALITDGDESLYAPVLNIDVQSTVGAGDSMVAGLVCGCMGDFDLENTFRMGVACATARCMTEGHKVVDKTIYKALLDKVRIERL